MDGMLMAGTLFLCLPLLALLGIGCLFYCRGKNRRHLALTAAVLCDSLLFLLGGEVLLGCFGLTWRNLPAAFLWTVALISGFLCVLLTLGCFLPLELHRWPAALRWGTKITALVCAVLVVYHAAIFGFLLLVFAWGEREQVVEYQGQTLVEVDAGFLDPLYDYYAYHGLLFRGSERLYSSSTHIWGDKD